MNETPTTFDRLAEAVAKATWHKELGAEIPWPTDLGNRLRRGFLARARIDLRSLCTILPTLGLKLVPVEATDRAVGDLQSLNEYVQMSRSGQLIDAWQMARDDEIHRRIGDMIRAVIAAAPDTIGENPHA